MTEIYSLSTNFPSGLNEFQLKTEILANLSISIPCTDVGRDGDVVNVTFSSPISPAEKTVLDLIISNYVFIAIPANANLYISNNVIKSDISTSTFTFLGDQPDEVHISKTSQSHYPSIKAALIARNEANIVFIVHPGTYVEDNPLTLPGGCCLIAEGNAENTFIVASHPTLDILNVGIRCKIEGFTFVGAAGPGARGIYFDGTQSGGLGRFSAFFECYIVDCNIGIEVDGKNGVGAIDTLYMREILIVTNSIITDKGIFCHSGGQTITSGVNIAGNPYFGMNEGVCCHDTGSKVSMTTSSIWFTGKAAHLDDGGELEVQLLTCKYNAIALEIGSSGAQCKINADLFNALNSTLYDINILSANAIIDIQSGIIDILKISNPNDVKINARFQSTQFGAYFQNILGDVVFGTKRVPAKLAIGEGTYDIDGVNIFTNDNLEVGTWTDSTVGAITIGAPPFNIFAGTSIGNCLYIGRNDNPVGIKMQVTTATTSFTPFTSVIWEYWNGTSWIQFTVSRSTSIPPYYFDGGAFFSNVGKYQIRFGITSATPLVAKTLNGVSKKWVRLRLLNTISSIPVREYCKLHVNSKEINTDGFTEYYGDSRPIAFLNWKFLNNTLDNIFLSTSIGINTFSFLSGIISRIGINTYLPTDTDIGFPIKLKISIVGDNSTAGNVNLVLKYASTQSGDAIYLSSNVAPTTATNEKSISITIPISTASSEFRGVFNIDISTVLTNPSNSSPDLVWLSIERDATSSNINDTYTGNIRVVNIDTQYVKMYSGAHLLGY